MTARVATTLTATALALALTARASLDAVERYETQLAYIETMMIDDWLWEPIVRKPVKMPARAKAADHFAAENPRPESAAVAVVNPFDEIVKLLSSNGRPGADVAFVMESVRRAMACSVAKHLSMQAYLLHRLYAVEPTSAALPYVTRWLKQMTQLAADKLTVVDWPMPSVARLNGYARDLLRDADAGRPAATTAGRGDRLNEIGDSVLLEADAVCARDDGRGVYADLILDFKSSMTDEQLESLEYLLADDENVKGLSGLNDVREMQREYGPLTVDENIDPAGLGRLGPTELKRLLTVNRVKMNYLYLNLPVASLAASQWNNVLGLNDPPPQRQNDLPRDGRR